MPLIRVLLVVAVLCTLAMGDEIIGRFQFEKLCAKAAAINYGGPTIPVGYELYNREGRWLTFQPKVTPEQRKTANATYQSLVKWDLVHTNRTSEWIPISQTDTRITDRRNGVLLASFSAYATNGGWVSRQFEKPLLVRHECLPADMRALNTRILPFQKPAFEPPPEPKEPAQDGKPPAEPPAAKKA